MPNNQESHRKETGWSDVRANYDLPRSCFKYR